MSPEQARGRQDEIGPSTDVYSLGVILYRMITGRVPFDGTVMEVLARAQFDEPAPPSSVRPELGSDLDGISLKAMAKKPEDRYASARDFADALEDYLRSKKEDRHRREVVEPNPPVLSPALTNDTSEAGSPLLPSSPQIRELHDDGATGSIECPACNARWVLPAETDTSARCPHCKATFSIVAGQEVAMLELSDAVPLPATPTPPIRVIEWQDEPEPVQPIRVIDWKEEESEHGSRERSRSSSRLTRRRVRKKASGCLDFFARLLILIGMMIGCYLLISASIKHYRASQERDRAAPTEIRK